MLKNIEGKRKEHEDWESLQTEAFELGANKQP